MSPGDAVDQETARRNRSPNAAVATEASPQRWSTCYALIGLLDPEATAIADSGGRVKAHLLPIEGGEQIARAYVDIAISVPTVAILERTVNGQSCLVAQLDGVTVTVYAFDVADGRIRRICAVRNPDKLRTWTTN